MLRFWLKFCQPEKTRWKLLDQLLPWNKASWMRSSQVQVSTDPPASSISNCIMYLLNLFYVIFLPAAPLAKLWCMPFQLTAHTGLTFLLTKWENIAEYQPILFEVCANLCLSYSEGEKHMKRLDLWGSESSALIPEDWTGVSASALALVMSFCCTYTQESTSKHQPEHHWNIQLQTGFSSTVVLTMCQSLSRRCTEGWKILSSE